MCTSAHRIGIAECGCMEVKGAGDHVYFDYSGAVMINQQPFLGMPNLLEFAV